MTAMRFFLVLPLLATQAFSQRLPQSEISLERLYKYPLVNGRSPAGATMSPDGKKIVFGWNQTGERKLDVWIVDFPSGSKRRIVDAAKIYDLPRQDDTRTDLEKREAELYDGGPGGYQWSPDSQEILFSYKGRAFTVKPDGGQMEPIFDGNTGARSFEYSPDGKWLAYQVGANIFRMDRSNGRTKQLTFLSKPNTTIDGFSWSPDAKNILVFWSDNSKLGKHVMMDFSKDKAEVVNIQRMWNGDQSQDTQQGVVSVEGGIVKWITGLPRYQWTKESVWSPDSKRIVIGWQKDDFQEYTISVVDAATLKKEDVYKEKAPFNYVNDWQPIVWTRDSKQLIFGTDLMGGQFGYRSIYKMDSDGKNIEPVYKESHDVGAMMRPKDSDRIILVTASRSPLSADITIIEPDGKRTSHVVMENGYSVPKGFNWADLPLVSEDGRSIATLASNRTLNNELYAVEPTAKRLTESQLPDFKKIDWAEFKEVSFPAPDGKTIYGVLITKKGFDTSKKHPALLSNIYADSGKLAWAGFMENYAAVNLDMVVLCVDFRSSWGYGGEFNSGYYKKMGLVDVDEAVAAKNYLASLPFVRGDRVGIWGWSYGGYLTCMTLLTKPGVFDTGVAVASVTDWKTYNEWYTRRRLGMVKEDKDKIFEKTSPITYASGLQDNLLLVHGMLDDNVLYQDTARLIQRLIDNGKYFDMLAYPRDDHGIGKETSRPHVFTSIMTYLYQKLYRN
jgi:dipeptidyl-peptidase-4